MSPLPKNAEGFEHVLTVTELHTRMRFTTLLKRKGNATLLDLISEIQRHSNARVVRVRFDNANEFLTKTILSLSRTHGFRLDPIVPHSPQSNAIAERFNRTLMSRVRATLTSMELPFAKYWGLCCLNTVEKLNLLHQSTVDDIPRRLWELYRHERSLEPARSMDLKQFRAFDEYVYVPEREAQLSK